MNVFRKLRLHILINKVVRADTKKPYVLIKYLIYQYSRLVRLSQKTNEVPYYGISILPLQLSNVAFSDRPKTATGNALLLLNIISII